MSVRKNMLRGLSRFFRGAVTFVASTSLCAHSFVAAAQTPTEAISGRSGVVEDNAGNDQTAAICLSRVRETNNNSPRSQVEAARDACAEALVENAGRLELITSYAQTLSFSGEEEASSRLFEWAAADLRQEAEPILWTLRALQDASKEPLSPAELAAAVGFDYRRLHAWVRDNVLLVPYKGRLRGAEGVLRDRRGNSADRALLVREALQAAGIETRLIHGKLNAADVELLVNPQAWPLSTRTFYTQPGTRAADAYAIASRRSESQARDLLEVIEGLREAPEVTHAQEREQAFAHFTDHWWVQANINGGWIDVDPSSEAVGTTSGQDGFDDTPADHTVTLRLMSSARDGERATILETTLVAADVAGEQILLLFHRSDARRDRSSWLPLITAGDEEILGAIISSDEGFLEPTPENLTSAGYTDSGFAPLAGSVESGIGGLIGAFDSVFGSGSAETVSNDDQSLGFEFSAAQWFEVQVDSPDRKSVITRRDLFDVRDVAEDEFSIRAREEAWLRPIILKIETSGLSDEAFLSRAIPVLDHIVDPSAGSSSDADAAMIIDALSLELDAFSHQRWKWNSSQAPYIDSPNVLALHLHFGNATISALEIPRRFDILVNAVGVWPLDGIDPFETRLRQGVLDTATEALVMREDYSTTNTSAIHEKLRALSAPGPGAAAGSHTASERLDASRLIEPVLVADDLHDRPGLGEAARARMLEVIESGHAVLLFRDEPISTPDVSWWSIEKSTGQTLGYTGQYGAVFSEEVTKLNFTINWAFFFGVGLGAAVLIAATCGINALICSTLGGFESATGAGSLGGGVIASATGSSGEASDALGSASDAAGLSMAAVCSGPCGGGGGGSGDTGGTGGATAASPAGLPTDAQRALNDIEQGVPRHNVRNPKPFRNDGTGGTPRLPAYDDWGRPIDYTEHTVNPRPPGGSLDGKRIIIGSDGSVWYTGDHFVSWTRVR